MLYFPLFSFWIGVDVYSKLKLGLSALRAEFRLFEYAICRSSYEGDSKSEGNRISSAAGASLPLRHLFATSIICDSWCRRARHDSLDDPRRRNTRQYSRFLYLYINLIYTNVNLCSAALSRRFKKVRQLGLRLTYTRPRIQQGVTHRHCISSGYHAVVCHIHKGCGARWQRKSMA